MSNVGHLDNCLGSDFLHSSKVRVAGHPSCSLVCPPTLRRVVLAKSLGEAPLSSFDFSEKGACGRKNLGETPIEPGAIVLEFR